MKIARLLLLACVTHFSSGQQEKHRPSPGIFELAFNNSELQHVVKTIYNNTDIYVIPSSNPSKCNSTEAYLHFLIIGIRCKGYFSSLQLPSFYLACLNTPEMCTDGKPGEYLKIVEPLDCTNPTHINASNDWKLIPGASKATAAPIVKNETKSKTKQERAVVATDKEGETPSESKAGDNDEKQSKSKIDNKGDGKAAKADENTPKSKNNKSKATAKGTIKFVVTSVPFMGEYMVILAVKDKEGASIKKQIEFDIKIKMKSSVGYLSADEHPLFTFYLVMCILYVFYAVAWLVMSACNYHDLLRVQFWIGGVILLGLIEKAAHYSEFLNVKEEGISQIGTEKFAAFVACLKRTLARMLVIIVSLGFGIVKPRLGPTLHKVIGIGAVYFIVALMEQMLSIDMYFNEGSTNALAIMFIPLAIVDSIICYWIFMSLLQTMKTLRLRRNTTKLSLYRHFANTILFCVLVSVGMMIWAIYYNRQACKYDFANGWFETACWPMLFSVILFVIMILWRPNANNQRYAYSPMIDGNGSDDEDDVEEPMLGSGATESMKMRGVKKVVRSDNDRTEEDLKWIEENIPQTVADAALPALLDSDEEEITVKYEMRKME